MKEKLDEQGIYDEEHIKRFQGARYQTAAAFDADDETEHRAMFAATQEPTDTYNERLKHLRSSAQAVEDAFERARVSGDEDGMKKADHERAQIAEAIGQMTEFKTGLARFSRTYSYIAQLIDLGDPGLENFAAFAKLLGNRLDGVPPENVDLRGITLTGYDIKSRENTGRGEGGEEENNALKPVGAGGSPSPGSVPVYIREIIEKLNGIFGEATPLSDQISFVNQVASIARENQVVMAQVEKNSKEDALKGNLPGAVEAAVARAMSSHSALARLLLKSDKQGLGLLYPVIYDLLKQGGQIELER